MNISNRFQMLHVAHPNSNWCRYCCGSCWWSFEREKLNTVLYLLSFFQLLYWTLNKKINISRPYQNFQKTKQKNNHAAVLSDVSIHPNPKQPPFGCREKQNIVFEWCWWFQQPTVPPPGVKSSSSGQAFLSDEFLPHGFYELVSEASRNASDAVLRQIP